jgi:hypothetical protein
MFGSQAATVPFINKAEQTTDRPTSHVLNHLPEDNKSSLRSEKTAPPESSDAPAASHRAEPAQEHYALNEKHASQGSVELEKPAQVAVPDDAVVDDEEAEEEGAHHVTGIPLMLLAFGLCVTTFLIGLDQMIIATAIPKITTQFNSLGDVGW